MRLGNDRLPATRRMRAHPWLTLVSGLVFGVAVVFAAAEFTLGRVWGGLDTFVTAGVVSAFLWWGFS